MKKLFSRSGTFDQNKAVLERELGYPPIFTPCKRIRLVKPNGAAMEIEAVSDKFIFCAFLCFISDGRESFLIDGELHQIAHDFFGPIWNFPDYPIIDFIRDPGVMVVILERG